MNASPPVNQPSFTVFRPASTIGTAWGGGIAFVTLVLGAGLVYKAQSMEVGTNQLWPFVFGGLLLVIAALYTYWTWSCQSLSYIVDRNSLSIRWGGVNQVIPLSKIERLIPAGDDENPGIEGINWLGHHVGLAVLDDLGKVLFYSAHRTMGDVLYVLTPTETYAISVPDQVFFAQTIQSNQSRGALFEQRQAVHRWGIAAQTFWQDKYARALAGVMVASFVVVLAYVLQMYPDLSQSIPLRFPSLGGIVRVSDKSALLDIPRSAFGFMIVNLILAIMLHTWERMVGYVLLLAGVAIQVTLLVAAIVAVA